MKKRRVFWIVIALLGVGLATWIAGEGGAADDAGPKGTLAFKRLLEELGHDVVEGELPAEPSTFVILADFRRPAEVEELLDWVGRGGRLVTTSPASFLAGSVGVIPIEQIESGPLTAEPNCVSPETLGVERIVVSDLDPVLRGTGDAFGCFPTGDGHFVYSTGVGKGRIVVLGGPSPLTNEFLRQEDNAVFAVGLVGGSEVVFGPPIPLGVTGTPEGAWASLPLRAKAVIIQIIAAVGIFAIVKGRRLGMRPVTELPSPIPANELVNAASRVYRVAGSTVMAAKLMREGTVARLAARLGLPPGATQDVTKATARLSGKPEADVESVLAGRDPSNDEELINLGARLESLRSDMEGD